MNTRLIVAAIVFLPVTGILFALVQAFLPLLPGAAQTMGAFIRSCSVWQSSSPSRLRGGLQAS